MQKLEKNISYYFRGKTSVTLDEMKTYLTKKEITDVVCRAPYVSISRNVEEIRFSLPNLEFKAYDYDRNNPIQFKTAQRITTQNSTYLKGKMKFVEENGVPIVNDRDYFYKHLRRIEDLDKWIIGADEVEQLRPYLVQQIQNRV